jgi:hypothetical protein
MATTSAVDSGNYRTWKFSMRMTLQAKELWEVVDGDVGVKPECPVRKFREDKDGERAVPKPQAKGARASVSM